MAKSKVIRGKRYDPKASIKHGSQTPTSPDYSNDYIITLCQRKKGGEFFLYKRSVEINDIKDKPVYESILPLSTTDAMWWAKKNLGAEKFELVFGEVGENGEMPVRVQISLWITEGQRKQAQEFGVTHAEVYAAGLKSLGEKCRNIANGG